MLNNKFLFAATLALLMLVGTPVFAGPVSTAQSELTKYVNAVKSSPTAAQKRAVRRAQAHLLVAREARAASKPAVAKAHAFAARAEILAVKSTAKLAALTTAQKTAKATATAGFTTALARMPTSGLLSVTCSGSSSPCGQACCKPGQSCGDSKCQSAVKEVGTTNVACTGIKCGDVCCNPETQQCMLALGQCVRKDTGVTNTTLNKETAE